MGTRSLLGYEQEDGKIYAQYMQFDGGPSCKGREFYEGCVLALREYCFINAETVNPIGAPTKDWFVRIMNFLNNYQYQSGHSITNHFTVSKKDWFSKKDLANSAWRYLFARNGDFIIYRPGIFTATIPWTYTTKMMNECGANFWRKITKHEPGLGNYWESLDKYEEHQEHKLIASWGPKKALLHLNDKFYYVSTKDVLAQVLKGEKVTVPDPILRLETVEYLVFPEQKSDGWRNSGCVKFNGKVILESDMDWETDKKRNEKTLTTSIEKS
jgi:hypothetical protein